MSNSNVTTQVAPSINLVVHKSTVLGQMAKLAILLCVIGYAFPIYGYPLAGSFKLTFWRAGLLLMAFVVVLVGARFRSQLSLIVLATAAAMIVMRVVSYYTSADPDRNLQQLLWFAEGALYLLGTTILVSKMPWLLHYYLRCVFVVGLLSIGIMALQYLALPVGILITLPLSTTFLGISPDLQPWTYPLYGGGRIIGAFYEPNMSGSMCAFFVAAFLPFLLTDRRSSPIRPFWLAAAIVITLIAMVGTGSRQSMVAAMLSAAIIFLAALLRGGKARKRVLILALVGVALLVVLALVGVFNSVETPFGEQQMNIFARFALDEGGDPTGGRLYYIQELLRNMTPYSFLFGMGEGAGIVTAHNAFLIVLNQNGVFTLLLLVTFSLLLLIGSAVLTIRQKAPFLYYLGVASTCIAATWIGLIAMNWAQLNQSLSFMYLVIPLMFFTAARLEQVKQQHFAYTGASPAGGPA